MSIEDNIEILLNKEINLNDLQILGVKIGDSIEKINKEIITETNSYQTRWIRTNKNIHFRTETESSNEIIEILFSEEIAKKLQIKSARDIIIKFGEPKEIEKRNDWHYYFYPNRKIVVAWKNEDNELFGIYFGDNVIKMTEFTAYNFLTKFYEFKGMVPNNCDWYERSLKGNPPRYYRLLELQSLMKAFNIGDDLIRDFDNQGFLEKRNPSDFEPIYKDIEAYAMSNEFEKKRFEMEKERMRQIGVKMIYQHFINFSETVRNVLNFNSGWLETGTINSRYIIHKTSQLLKTIDTDKLKDIEELIALIIDPKKQSFTKGELIRNYNYPDVDL
jgi:hypothetical protein